MAEYEISPVVIDPWANVEDAKKEYNVELSPLSEAKDADCVIFAVAHNEFKELSKKDIEAMFKKESSPSERVLIDVKGLRKMDEFEGYKYWRL